eukprot:1196078-Prorocentrum_minimum.AAC.9
MPQSLKTSPNNSPGIRLRNFFVERGGGKVGRWTVFSALSGWVLGSSGLLYCLSPDELHPLLGAPAAGIQALRGCHCRWASIRSFGADIMGPCGDPPAGGPGKEAAQRQGSFGCTRDLSSGAAGAAWISSPGQNSQKRTNEPRGTAKCSRETSQ